MKKLSTRMCLLIGIFAMTASQLPAARPAEILTPQKCRTLGISVAIRHQAGALHHGVTVKVDKSAERFMKEFLASLRTDGFSIPVKVTEDAKGNRVMSFSMTRELLGKTRLWLDGDGFIELKAFLDTDH